MRVEFFYDPLRFISSSLDFFCDYIIIVVVLVAVRSERGWGRGIYLFKCKYFGAIQRDSFIYLFKCKYFGQDKVEHKNENTLEPEKEKRRRNVMKKTERDIMMITNTIGCVYFNYSTIDQLK